MEAIFFAVVSVIACVAAARFAELRRPLAVYAVSYVVTTVIGAIVIGVEGADALDALSWKLDVSYISTPDTMRYWGLLFVPLIVAPICAAVLARRSAAPTVSTSAVIGGEPSLRPAAMLAPFALILAYVVVTVTVKGYWGVLDMIGRLEGDYEALMGLRSQIGESFGTAFFGVLYSGLPAFCHCALYMAIKTGKRLWWAMYVGLFAIAAVTCIALVSKALILLLLVFTAIALVELGVVSWRLVGIASGSAFVLLAVLQSFYTGDAVSMLDTTRLVVFRMAVSFPYYIASYPSVLPYVGIDFGLGIVGMGRSPQDNLDVFNLMYPSVHYVQGAVAAPAHLRALAQAGPWFAVVTTALIGVTLWGVGRLRRAVRGPISFAIYIQSLVTLYYLTQVSLPEAFESSYGLIWAVACLAPVRLLNEALRRRRTPALSTATIESGA